MAIANPLVIAYDGSNISMVKVNSGDPYASEYLARTATDEFRVRIRHSTESVQKNGIALERHNVELTRTTFGTAGAPDQIEQIYFVLRNAKRDPAATVAKLGDMMTAFATNTHYQDLVTWVS